MRRHRIAPDDADTSFFTPSPVSAEAPAAGVAPLGASARSHSISQLSLNEPHPSYTPPWTEPYIIGIAGYSGSGKTSISQRIIQELNQPWTILLSFDNFYNPLTPRQRQQAFECEFDFDTPDSLDLDLLVGCVQSLKEGHKTEIPNYSFTHHNRTDRTTTIYGATVIIIEGIYALYDQRLLDMMDVKIFVDTDLDVCLARRLGRDILVRGRELQGAMKQWEKFVKPNAVRHVMHTMNNADLVVPRGLDNTVGINMMIKHIQNQLALKSALHLKRLQELGGHQHKKFGELVAQDNVKILPTTNHTRGINAILFNAATDRSDFILYFNIMAFRIIELALDFDTNYRATAITTLQGYQYQGCRSDSEIIAVNIIRSGDCFMSSIRKTLPDVVVGKLLIQSDSLTGEPQLHTESLPPSIKQSKQIPRKVKILLFDAQIISGAASIMAIQVLVDYGVAVSDIVLCSYLSTEIGLRRILHAFPQVKLALGKVSNLARDAPASQAQHELNPEGFKDTDWVFNNRYIDSLYFGTD
ncbi:Uridine kinase [[Candida] zeylanoides]